MTQTDVKQLASDLIHTKTMNHEIVDAIDNLADALLNYREQCRNEAIEDLIKRFERKAEEYQAIGTPVGDGLACTQLDMVDAIRPFLKSLKSKQP